MMREDPEFPLLDPASLAAERILLIAPHPDDESLGCGGLVAALAPLGRRFHVVFVTEGGASHRGSATWPRPRLAAVRRQEAEAALALLGVADHGRSFLDLPDAAMPAPDSQEGVDAIADIARIVEAFSPELVLLPWRRDPHCDHRDSWALANAALAQLAMEVETLEYAVWLDEIGAPQDRPRDGEMERVGFDVAAVAASKRAAVEVHLSQTSNLIDDDPEAFRLTPETIDRLTGPVEFYWRPAA